MSSLILLPLTLFFTYILQLTQVTSYSKTLTNSIFCNIISLEAISGYLNTTIFGHLPQFMIVPNVFCNPASSNAHILERDWSNLDQESFILDFFSIDWHLAHRARSLVVSNLRSETKGSRVPDSSPAASYKQRRALCSNLLANV